MHSDCVDKCVIYLGGETMKIRFILFIMIFFLGGSSGYANSEKSISEELLSEYKKFSLAECIEKNYEKMGVVFTKLPLKDNTRGFIDMDMGLAFYRNKYNPLASFIENKTGIFINPDRLMVIWHRQIWLYMTVSIFIIQKN